METVKFDEKLLSYHYQVYENEKLLSDDYPVYENELYICAGHCVKSPINGTVKDLRNNLYVFSDLWINTIKNCDTLKRGKELKVYSLYEYAKLLNPDICRSGSLPLPF